MSLPYSVREVVLKRGLSYLPRVSVRNLGVGVRQSLLQS